ncbi:MAG: 2-polyprenyl-3-methyl-6-methoxy-1,4-benzoquinone monooxygenase [Burkholderiaceae bacterium]
MDKLILGIDKLLRLGAGVSVSSRPNPGNLLQESELNEQDRRHSAGLMRVNHVGEICAQALYDSQSHFAKNGVVKWELQQAAKEEEDHLAWTSERLEELGARPSLLNPLWYAGSYAIGAVAARLGDAQSLGFVVETERQVEAHLAGHLEELPPQDLKSRAIVQQMHVDEISHGQKAQAMGAAEVPFPARMLMRAMAKVMTKTAYYL